MGFENRKEWLDADWWRREIDKIVSIEDPVLSNLRVTQAHYRLSQLLHDVTGENSGANFHTWAVWGSKKAGETIRQEDTRRVRHATRLLSGGFGAGLIATGVITTAGINPIAWIAAGSAVALTPNLFLHRVLKRTSREILEGNRTVLEDIGNVTASFVSAFHGCAQFDSNQIERFIESLRPGKTEVGGQSLLGRAFLFYYQATHEGDLDRKHEQMFLANCYAILHEHIRLEPYIRKAIPRLFRRSITARILRFYLGGEALGVHDDVPSAQDHVFPETLRELDNSELIAFLQGMEAWDRTPNTVEASGATDWSDLRDRMNFIVDLFRTRHLSPAIFASPFTDEQDAELFAGRVPAGKL